MQSKDENLSHFDVAIILVRGIAQSADDKSEPAKELAQSLAGCQSRSVAPAPKVFMCKSSGLAKAIIEVDGRSIAFFEYNPSAELKNVFFRRFLYERIAGAVVATFDFLCALLRAVFTQRSKLPTSASLSLARYGVVLVLILLLVSIGLIWALTKSEWNHVFQWSIVITVVLSFLVLLFKDLVQHTIGTIAPLVLYVSRGYAAERLSLGLEATLATAQSQSSNLVVVAHSLGAVVTAKAAHVFDRFRCPLLLIGAPLRVIDELGPWHGSPLLENLQQCNCTRIANVRIAKDPSSSTLELDRVTEHEILLTQSHGEASRTDSHSVYLWDADCVCRILWDFVLHQNDKS